MAKDPFGFGTEEPQEEPQMTKETVEQISEAAKQIMMQGEPIPDDLRETILSVSPTDAYKLRGNDFGEEWQALSIIAGNKTEKREDGRWAMESLLLKEGQTPEMFFLKHYPPREEQEAKGQMDTGQASEFGYEYE